MDTMPTRYAVLCDHRHWDGVDKTVGLESAPDGALTLARVPGPVNGQAVLLPAAYEVEPSGLAAGGCGDLYLADPSGGRVVWLDGVCNQSAFFPGQENAGCPPGSQFKPCGLVIGPTGGVYVSDMSRGMIRAYQLPGLDFHLAWGDGLHTPTGLAVDSRERIYVLDRGLARVLRFSPWGEPDDAYNAIIAEQAELTNPQFLAVSDKDILYISDGSNQLLCFDTNGKFLGELSGGPAKPRALAVFGDRLFIADAEEGQIWIWDIDGACTLGPLPGYRGPVAGMAAAEDGSLYIKPGQDDRYFHFLANQSVISSGMLVSGPFDAGESTDWMRIFVSAEEPKDTKVGLKYFTSGDPNNNNTPVEEKDWIVAKSLDTLVSKISTLDPGLAHPQRFLWLRLELTTEDPQLSPRLVQCQVQTPGPSLMDYLPPVYRRADAPQQFLERLLALLELYLYFMK